MKQIITYNSDAVVNILCYQLLTCLKAQAQYFVLLFRQVTKVMEIKESKKLSINVAGEKIVKLPTFKYKYKKTQLPNYTKATTHLVHNTLLKSLT